jgi:hypothetical protein
MIASRKKSRACLSFCAAVLFISFLLATMILVLTKSMECKADVPYIREHQVSSDVDVITTTVTTSVRSSVSATVSAGLAAKFPPEELKSFRINAVMPNFDYLRAVTVDVFENEPIVSIESLYKVRVQFHTPLYLQL